jgi:hypothetical protein
MTLIGDAMDLFNSISAVVFPKRAAALLGAKR